MYAFYNNKCKKNIQLHYFSLFINITKLYGRLIDFHLYTNITKYVFKLIRYKRTKNIYINKNKNQYKKVLINTKYVIS